MSRTALLQNQHKELLVLVSDIGALLDPDRLAQDAPKVRSLLSELLGKLRVHLVLEDKALYPSLLASSDEDICKITRAYIDEMGGLSRSVDAYSTKWYAPTVIRKDPQSFIDETKQVFRDLSGRIEREDSELYPIVDRLPK